MTLRVVPDTTQKYQLSSFNNESDTSPGRTEADWSQIVEALTKVHCHTKKGADCWSPATYPLEGEAARRAAENVIEVGLLSVDIDHVDAAVIRQVREDLSEYRYVAHPTFSSGKGGELSYRFVLPLSRPVSRGDWLRFWLQARKELCLPIDEATKDCSRLYYMPSRPEGADFECFVNEGKDVDVDGILSRSDGSAGAQTVVADIHDYPPGDSLTITDLLDLCAGDDGLFDRIVKPVPDGGDKSTRVWGVVKDLLRLGTPPEVVSSVLNTQDFSGVWAHVSKNPPRNTNRAISRALAAIEAETSGGTWLDYYSGEDEGPLSKLEIEQLLIPNARKRPEDSLTWKACAHNCMRIFRYSDGYYKCLRYNEVTKDVEFSSGPFAGSEVDDVVVDVKIWLETEWGIFIDERRVSQYLFRAAKYNPYDPIKDYLEGLVWDGVPRLDTWLTSYCGACTTLNDRDISKYVAAVGRKWLISAVARGISPGAKVDTVLVLEGAQGQHKSTVFDVLGGEYFTDTALRLSDKDTRSIVGTHWIVELSELESIRGGNRTSHKSFLSSRKDTFRPPYGRTVETHPRRAVFGGTTNEVDYLEDRTGNRRWWPVQVTSIDIDRLRQDRDQLFAEAVCKYRSGEPWHFTVSEQRNIDYIANERLEFDVLEEVLTKWIYEGELIKIRLSEALDHLSIHHPGLRTDDRKVIKTLRGLGYSPRRTTRDGVEGRYWSKEGTHPVV